VNQTQPQQRRESKPLYKISLTWQASGHLNINKLKTATSLFSLSTSKDKVKLKLDDHSVPQVETPTCLGATRDSRLTLTSNIEAAEKRAYTKLSLKRSWQEQAGGNGKFLRQVYTGAVHPIAEYASFSWITASKPRKGKLDKVQNAGLTWSRGQENYSHKRKGEYNWPWTPRG